MNAEPVQPGPSMAANVENQASTVTNFQTDASNSTPLPKKQKIQKSHFERFKPFDGPRRSEECIKRSIAFFSTCENFDDCE